MNIIKQLPKPFFVLAPMDDVTDTVFRQVVAECAPPDLYFTEFMNVDGYCSEGKQMVAKKIKKTDKESPIIAQIWGRVPENYYKTAYELAQLGFDGIDINMGCPIKTITKNGCCSALINDKDKAKEVIDSVRGGIEKSENNIPISVKTRIGSREFDASWIEFLLAQKLDMLTIHMRSVKDMSKVPARWELMPQIKELRDKIAPNTALVGNGDITTLQQGHDYAQKYGVDGIMIGRGIFHDPFVFSANDEWATKDPKSKTLLYKRHIELFEETWAGQYKTTAPLNKFCKIYINGFDGAKELREKLMDCKTTQELLKIIENSL